MGGLDNLPYGLFSSLLNLWEKFRFVMVDIVAFLTEETISLLGYGNYSILDFMIGSGLVTFIVVVIVRFTISTLKGG